MTAVNPCTDNTEPGHLVVFSHPDIESQTDRTTPSFVPLPRFESPRPSQRP